ncbi:C45 family autoproteolytic acyltransferase/hydolase [Mesorhizobium kowhaii]|uniref:Acyl-CoA--6-aminopenicillanic acid acyltransferase n=1 Tax=Mesorhizobium kowhaii TaxID=1300272 RepID=A0A2W7BZX8_9HYPH|nr:C45 family peptidase [Mesorhizobium kowhaii]PZV36385.1 acyl-CoA--6-aminopenicillanic acid acyltransferase [Mesorhizobium kowhaii]
MSIPSFPLVEIAGPPFSRGQQYGRAARERIARSVRIYSQRLLAMSYAWNDVREIVRGFVPTVEEFAPDYLEEMRGIADGAGCSFEEIVLVNARTEILEIGRKATAREAPDGCTGVIVMPEMARDGALIHAQNWDWLPECAQTGVVLMIRTDDGPDILTFTEAGGLARSGLNSAGLAITANYLESDRDYDRPGIPLPFIRRKFLESQHLAQGIKTVATTPKSGSNNMMLSTAAGFAIDFECAPDESFPILPERGVLAHANHWTSPAALSKLRDTGIANVPESYYRDYRVRERLGSRGGGLAVEDVKDALFDRFGEPFSVCRPWRPEFPGSISETVAMIVMQPARGLMEVAPAPARNRHFTVYSLTMDTKGAAEAAA